MKKIVFTQRVEVVEAYEERRDCADQEIAKLLSQCGYLPIPVPNVPDLVSPFMESVGPEGLLLTGGNDLCKYGGKAPERDETEYRLLEYGISHKLPIYGFCRGMQLIADYFGCGLKPVENHVRTNHILNGDCQGEQVNSYHCMAVKEIRKPLIATSWSEDGSIESMKHESLAVLATMWHPERTHPYSPHDLYRIKAIFG